MMDGEHLINSLELDEDPVRDNEVGAEARFKAKVAVYEGNLLMSDDIIAALDQLEREALFINGFEQTRPEIFMNYDCGSDDGIRDFLICNLCALCVLCGEHFLSGVAQRRSRPVEDALENRFPVRAAEERVAGAFGVGHESENVAGFVADAGDVLP